MSIIIETKKLTKIFKKHHTVKAGQNPNVEALQKHVATLVDTLPEVIALDHVDVSIEAGDFVCIMGPSGSGKTTLLNTISTIDMPTSGKVLIDGKNVRELGEVEIGKFRYQYLGFIFQQYNLLDNLSLFENIALPLTFVKSKDEEIEKRVREVASEFTIEELLNKYPSECSGGQCQRCAIARALVNHPKLIVADEPTGNLDSKNSHEILHLLKALNKNDQVTIVMVTHDAMIASYANQVLFIVDGKIDSTIKRESLTQKQFYHEIMETTSSEALSLMENTQHKVEKEEAES